MCVCVCCDRHSFAALAGLCVIVIVLEVEGVSVVDLSIDDVMQLISKGLI